MCDATATLNRKLVLQLAYVAVLAGLLFAAAQQDSLVPFAFAVMAASVFRHALYMALMGRVLGFGLGDHLRLYLPVLLTAAGVALGIAGVTTLLRPVAPLVAVLLAQIATGAVVVLLAFLWGPLVAIRRDVRSRLEQSGLLAGDRRLARLLRAGFDLGR